MTLLDFLQRMFGGWSGRPAPLSVAPDLRLIVGLGNPGPEYARSRHNVGFMVVDRFAEQHAIRFNQKRDHSLVARGRLVDVEIVLAKPQTYMNVSGRAVQSLLATHGVKPGSLLVVYDDFDLPLGTLRLRQRGSPGTHNGMRSIVEALGSQTFPRLRIGIGAVDSRTRHEYVLGDFDEATWAVFEGTLDRAVQTIETFLREGAHAAMNQFNS